MKTLIFNGSPRKNGNSSFCCEYIKENISGDIKIINAYEENIQPCMDCRYCIKEKKCLISDNMSEIIEYIEKADRIIIVSPLYFSTLTGKLLLLFSRTQLLYNAKIKLKEKKGVLLLIGGGTSKNIEPAQLTGRVILKQLGCSEIAYLSYVNTDCKHVKDYPQFFSEILNLLGGD